MKLLSRKLCKGLLTFPEDFPAMLAVLTFWKRQVATCVDASPCCLWAEQLAVKSCPFSPGCVEPVSLACQALELKLIQKEGPVRGAAGKAWDLELQVEREARTRKEKKKKQFTKFSQLSVVPNSGNFFSGFKVGEGNSGTQWGQEAAGFTPSSPARRRLAPGLGSCKPLAKIMETHFPQLPFTPYRLNKYLQKNPKVLQIE